MATLTIPDDLYRRIEAAAARQQRPIDDVIREVIEYAASTRVEEMQRLRKTLSDDIESPNSEMVPTHLRPHESPIDHAALRASMPILDPPLSSTVIEEREDRA